MEKLNLVTGILNVVVLLFLSYQDFKYKKINIIVIGIYGIIAAFLSCMCATNYENIIFGMLPGFALIIISALTRGEIGVGDGLLVLALGLSIGFRKTAGTLVIALVFNIIAGLILIVAKRATLKTALPFVPFLLSGYIVCEIINQTAKG